MIIQIAFWLNVIWVFLTILLVGTQIAKEKWEKALAHLIQAGLLSFTVYAFWTVWP